MQCGELLTNIFINVSSPLNLILTCKDWYNIFNDDSTRAEWVVYQCGRAHALYHAIRLDPFIDSLRQNSRRRSPWASDLDIQVFIYLLEEADRQFKSIGLSKAGNDMELFFFLSAGPHEINDARIILGKNRDHIEDLILKYKFIPFPPRPKHLQTQTSTNIEEYPAKDGFENNKQLNIIARAILLSKDLVSCWKKIEILNRKVKGIECFEFLYNLIVEDRDKRFLDAMNILLKNKSNDYPFKPLEFSAMYYNWCLYTFGKDAEITEWCFEDILETRISMNCKQDQKYQDPTGLMQDEFKNNLVINPKASSEIEQLKFINIKMNNLKIEQKKLDQKDEWSNELRKLYIKIFSSDIQIGTFEFRAHLKSFWESVQIITLDV
ncbi:2207_t:CDS:2 [Gigaspora margarita]|uniref:2207_t:CDS:1 n=1 Tax=Gigaspora margarita TaxID=4874 RepID=A0ABM8W2V0_GIGMA|nr:2207_t:CDS:2 [Gigaspora margarita]